MNEESPHIKKINDVKLYKLKSTIIMPAIPIKLHSDQSMLGKNSNVKLSITQTKPIITFIKDSTLSIIKGRSVIIVMILRNFMVNAKLTRDEGDWRELLLNKFWPNYTQIMKK